jgi:hypothetical protein
MPGSRPDPAPGAQIRAKSPRASKATEARQREQRREGRLEGRNEGGIDALPYQAGKVHRVVVVLRVAPHVPRPRVGARGPTYLSPAPHDARG